MLLTIGPGPHYTGGYTMASIVSENIDAFYAQPVGVVDQVSPLAHVLSLYKAFH